MTSAKPAVATSATRRTAPFEQRVGRDGRAVREHVERATVGASSVVDRPFDRARRIVRRRRDLGDAPVVGDDVGERPAAVDPEPHAGRR